MSGRFKPASPAPGALAPRQRPWSDEADSTASLPVALALSCLLHAAAVLLPYLGTPAGDTPFAFAGRRAPAPVLNATLAPAGAHSYAVPEVPAMAEPAQQHRAEGAGLLPLAGQRYYRTDQLTKRPQPLAVVDLDTPQVRPIVASGKIVLTLWIDELGLVADIAVEETGLPEAFARTAVAAFKGLRFAPGERNGLAVGTVMRIEITYDDGRMRAF